MRSITSCSGSRRNWGRWGGLWGFEVGIAISQKPEIRTEK